MIRKSTSLLMFIALCGLIVVAAPRRKEGRTEPPPAAAVKVSNFKFEPKVLTIKEGTTVTWSVEGGTHTVISDGKTFTSPSLSSGKSFSHQFAKAGKYPYHCSLHGSAGGNDMAGEIVVTK